MTLGLVNIRFAAFIFAPYCHVLDKGVFGIKAVASQQLVTRNSFSVVSFGEQKPAGLQRKQLLSAGRLRGQAALFAARLSFLNSITFNVLFFQHKVKHKGFEQIISVCVNQP